MIVKTSLARGDASFEEEGTSELAPNTIKHPNNNQRDEQDENFIYM